MKKINKKFKNILISGYYGFGNFGDEAILEVLIKKLKELGMHITVFSKNPKKTSELYKVNSKYFFNPLEIFSQIINCDTLISGGGSLLQDVTSIKSLFYYLFIINIALFFRKKVIIFAQGIGPINNKFGAFLTKKTLKRCSLVTVRDRKSNMLLQKWGIAAELVCDPLLGLSLPINAPSGKVGVQLRSFKTLSDKLLTKLAQQINLNFCDKEIEIFSFQDSLDLEVCKKFEQILKSINPKIKINLIYNQTSSEILDKISKLDYMIAMRFHAVLIALKYGIKTLAVCYDIKVEKLAQEVQIPFVSMNCSENFKDLFNTLINLNPELILDFASSKHFDWAVFEKIIKENTEKCNRSAEIKYC
jgi:polysaccharide pyruvyl transferase CsaB